ncbi:hypothetical protein [Kitasatospora purpeofusca]|uniref:hypothetical protein n=1 Tax=Kitasatospora purpeofusca TaxID=67352 RepID=UPI0036ABCED1
MRTRNWQAGPMAISATRARRLRRMERERDYLARTLSPETVLRLREAIGLTPSPEFGKIRGSFVVFAPDVLEVVRRVLRDLIKRTATTVRRRTPKVLTAKACHNDQRSLLLRARRLALAGSGLPAGASRASI